MKKDRKQTDYEELEEALRKFIDEDLEPVEDLDGFSNMDEEEEDDEIDLDDDDEMDNLPFPSETINTVGRLLTKSNRGNRECMEDILAIEMKLATDQNCYTDAILVVTFKGRPETLLRKSRFICKIFTEDYYPVCEDFGATDNENDLSQVTMVIPCSNIWMPGKYLMVVADDEDCSSVKCIHFTLDEQLKITQGDWKKCGIISMEYAVASCLQCGNPNWDDVSQKPGASQVREKAIQAIRMQILNEFRKEHYGELWTNMNKIVCLKNPTTDYLKELQILTIPDYPLNIIDCSKLFDITRTNPYELLPETLENSNMKAFCLTRLKDLTGSSGKIIMRKVLDKVRHSNGRTPLWLCGTHQEVEDLFEMFPSLREFFSKDSWIEQQPSNAYEIVQTFLHLMEDRHLAPDVHVKDRLARTIIQAIKQGNLTDWTTDEVRLFIESEIIPQYTSRLLTDANDAVAPYLTEDDIPFDKLTKAYSAYEQSISKLNEMIGLDDVKQSIISMANQTRLFMERHRRGLKTSNKQVYHCIFTGNPGTGKTTVARQLGKIYHTLGILSKGEVIAVDRTRLVGQYIGQTEENMKTILEEAKGNVLFIDEAYTLFTGSEDSKDFGQRVLDSLLTVLTRPNPDMLIVFAGYTHEMDAMLSSNSGLANRFPYRYHFEDYTAEQLMEIAQRLFESEEYTLTDDAIIEMQKAIAEALREKTAHFGNARWIEQFIRNGIIPAMANRIFSTGTNDFQSIMAPDIRKAFEKFRPKSTELKPRHRVVGFSA